MWMRGRNNQKINTYYSLPELTKYTAFTAEVSSATTPLIGDSPLLIYSSWNMQQVSLHLSGDESIYANSIKSLTSGFSFPLAEIELTLALLQTFGGKWWLPRNDCKHVLFRADIGSSEMRAAMRLVESWLKGPRNSDSSGFSLSEEVSNGTLNKWVQFLFSCWAADVHVNIQLTSLMEFQST